MELKNFQFLHIFFFIIFFATLLILHVNQENFTIRSNAKNVDFDRMQNNIFR